MRRLAFVLATLVALCAALPARAGAGAPAAVTYKPPVDAPVVDPFRPAEPNWTSGNRGLEYATTPATPVAAAAGEVVFAGPVAGGLHVVILHDDGLRTSYSFLQLVAVKRGDKVAQGQTVGTTQDRFHFGVRAGEAYLDPALLFGGGPPQVHLVPDELRRPQSEAKEREGLIRMFPGWAQRTIAAGGTAYQWAQDKTFETIDKAATTLADELRGAYHYATDNTPQAHAERFLEAAHAWWKARSTCTAESVPAPKLQERHILVRVAGLGSTSRDGPIDQLDAAALGYAPGDDYRYSYTGGTVKENPYAVTDTTNDIRESAGRLRDLLVRLAAENPGVPIDIVAHSQGGLVARSALTDEGEPTDPRLPEVNALVTLGSPHLGAPAATGLTMLGNTGIGSGLVDASHQALPNHVDPGGTSVRQMAAHSEFMERLNSKPLPPGLKVTSIGAREDLIVPAGRTLLAGAHNVTVSAPTHDDDHGELPGSPEARREVALGLAGMAPTCQSFGDAMADAAVSGLVYATENGLGGGGWMAARRFDKWLAEIPKTHVPRRYDHDSPR
ncbi:MAG TPA: peptidoglycan DD-metalloendopeptidase family protein [Acidimicrobiales bacterium]|nr:peptidoglycan DD-metalloendopeptidase family protein [Acidimicrobiales bacterium]